MLSSSRCLLLLRLLGWSAWAALALSLPAAAVDLKPSFPTTEDYTTGAGVAMTRTVEGDAAAGRNSIATFVAKKSTDSTLVYLQADSQGRLITVAITGFGADFSFGDVTTSSTTVVAINRTAYTEPASVAAFSIKSASAADAAAGTGARTVLVTYYDNTAAALASETVTLNGTTCVNSVTTLARFFEKASVVTAGSGLANAGLLTLYTGTGCSTVAGTIAVGDNQTFWAHHYVAAAKTANITGISVNHNGTTVGSGAVFVIKSKPIGVTNAVETQSGDFHRLYGQSSTSSRVYASPIKVVGPARVQVYATPETASTTVYRASIDFFEP